ncbi:molybdopterin molybdotransferase MoeA [Thalassotalea maritima]|uniref:molybdopterin molybdotransferase MoeA n=1 Tax=Thalassotalea maritima TaxID=3242416 RepID=UPI003527B7FF
MIDPCANPELMPFSDAKQQLLASVKPIKKTQMLAINDALGRVLAIDVQSTLAVPGHDNSAMDGYAFYLDKQPSCTSLKVVGKSFAGNPYKGEVNLGECVRIMTGGIIPDGCNTVVMQENVTAREDHIVINHWPQAKANVRYAGEDIALGATIFKCGHQLTAVDIGMLASLGITHVDVYKKVSVAIMATGDELKSPGERLTAGDIYESNRFALHALLSKMNVDIIDLGIIGDDEQALAEAFLLANQQADIVISSGGVSVGEADYTKQVLESLGEITFWKIAMKPGKPFAFGRLSESLFCGLPGNPVSSVVTFYQLVVPAIEKMQGKHPTERPRFLASCQGPLKKRPGRMDFQRGILSYPNGQPIVSSTGGQGSGILSSFDQANCFIILAREQGAVADQEQVWVEPFDYLLS